MRLPCLLRGFLCFILAFGFTLETTSARFRANAPDRLRHSYRSHGQLAWHASSGHTARYCFSCQRDQNDRIRRSSSVPRQFQREHPCPSTGLQTGACPGYIKDHIVLLKLGGADTASNMQWEQKAEAKAKDRVE